jgi:transposase
VPAHADPEAPGEEEAPLPCACPHCQSVEGFDEERVEEQYQTDIQPLEPVSRRFRVHVGRCRSCGRRVQGRHPLQTSDAPRAASVQIGPGALALAAAA